MYVHLDGSTMVINKLLLCTCTVLFFCHIYVQASRHSSMVVTRKKKGKYIYIKLSMFKKIPRICPIMKSKTPILSIYINSSTTLSGVHMKLHTKFGDSNLLKVVVRKG
eukprot:GHVU01227049.1.p1 GENE.GHVU01227049.1~~GHVU01227049.1.p1  ORF type:complete len:108 (+),score=2.82 GHVU01227049.1:392-715(+)